MKNSESYKRLDRIKQHIKALIEADSNDIEILLGEEKSMQLRNKVRMWNAHIVLRQQSATACMDCSEIYSAYLKNYGHPRANSKCAFCRIKGVPMVGMVLKN